MRCRQTKGHVKYSHRRPSRSPCCATVLRRQPLPQPDTGPVIGSEYDAAMARYDMRKQGDKFFQNCMENKGYRRSSKPFSLF